MPLDTTTAVFTPERVRFRYRVAGPGRRGAAWIGDLTIQTFAALLVGLVAFLLSGIGLDGVGQGGFLVMAFGLQWFYGAFFETLLSGRTPGKWALGIRVVTTEGAPATVPQYVLRNLLRGADFLPFGYGVGVGVMAVDRRSRRIGDLVAGTVVVDESKGQLLSEVPIEPPVSEEERRELPPRIELRREEIRGIGTFLRRREQLTQARAIELAEPLAASISARTGLAHADPVRLLTLAYARATGRDRSVDEG